MTFGTGRRQRRRTEGQILQQAQRRRRATRGGKRRYRVTAWPLCNDSRSATELLQDLDVPYLAAHALDDFIDLLVKDKVRIRCVRGGVKD